MSALTGVVIFIFILILVYKRLELWRSGWDQARITNKDTKQSLRVDHTGRVSHNKNSHEVSQYLESHDWKSTVPLQLRPFKQQYNLTMAVEKADLSEMIQIDQDFHDRVHLRNEIVLRNPTSTVQASPASQAAVNELYIFLVTEYLPTRFNSLFSIVNNPAIIEKSFLVNNFNKTAFSLRPDQSPKETLKRMATLIDEDLMFLLPSVTGGYTLQAYVICFSSGFSSAESGTSMLGKSLEELHTKVPGYAIHLATKMGRWIGKMKAGTYWKRCNWTITMNGKLRNEIGENQVYHDEEGQNSQAFDVKEGHLRTEFQFMQRLPQSQAILFSYKTYVYPLSKIKEEGNGEALAKAIEGLRSGNAPDMWHYKGAGVWVAQVMEYLRHQS